MTPEIASCCVCECEPRCTCQLRLKTVYLELVLRVAGIGKDGALGAHNGFVGRHNAAITATDGEVRVEVGEEQTIDPDESTW